MKISAIRATYGNRNPARPFHGVEFTKAFTYNYRPGHTPLHGVSMGSGSGHEAKEQRLPRLQYDTLIQRAQHPPAPPQYQPLAGFAADGAHPHDP
jgi:hypothetical protein